MKQYQTFAREFLSEYTGTLRKRRKLTQEEMEEQLHITTRAYGDLERGKYCFSALALLFLLLILSEEEVKGFLEKFRKRTHEIEHREVA